MRTIKTNIYKFDELSENAKQHATEKLYDINVDFEWWESMYEDAENIGLKITGFDIDRGNYCSGEFNLSACEVAQNIFNEHGEKCSTFKTASDFMEEWQPVFNNYMNETHEDYESGELEEDMIFMEDEFKKDLLENYLVMLRNEFEWRMEEKQIIETIEANEYEFTEDGEMF